MRVGGAETQSLVSTPNTPGLNPKYFRNANDVEAYVLFMGIRPSDGDVKPDDPLDAFR
jgi:hypothetical protein